jgi:hypothetical protein
VSNWRFIYLGNNYADLFASPSLVQHFWSLSIEEQFYLTYPLIAIVLLGWGGRRALAGVLAGLTMLSTLWMATLFEPDLPTSRLYFGTDTRVAEILLGGLFALWHAGRPPLRRTARRVAAVLGGVGVAGTFVFWFAVSEYTHWLWQGGFSLYALITVAAIAGAVQPVGPARSLLGWGPFPWLGKISYGVYRYHVPVYVTLTPHLTGIDLWPLFVLRVAVTFALSVASYYLLELPVRRGHLVTGWRPWLVLPSGVAAASLALVVATIDPPAPAVDLRELSDEERLVKGSGPRIMVVGGSVAFGIGKALQRWAHRTGRASVYNLAEQGCGVARGGRLKGPFRHRGRECDGWPKLWANKLDVFAPDVVVVLTGGWDMIKRKLPSWEETRVIGDEVYDAWLLSEFDSAVELLSSQGARVVWLTTPCYEKFAIRSELGGPERVRSLNAILERLAADRRVELELLDLFAKVCPDGEFTNALDGVADLRPDGTHFSDPGADWLAGWLAPQVLAASRSKPPDR